MECQDVSRRAVVSASLAQEHPFVVALEDCSSTPVLGTNKLVTKFLEDHSKLDLPICLSILNGRSKRVRDLKIKYLPTQDETLQKIYKHSGSSVNWFRKPYAKIYLVTCENIADYKKKVRPRLKELIDGGLLNIDKFVAPRVQCVHKDSGHWRQFGKPWMW